MTNSLEELREQIDHIDEKIMALLNDRLSLVAAIGRVKKSNAIEPLDKERWQEVITARIHSGKGIGLSENVVRNVWEAIHEEALIIEKNI